MQPTVGRANRPAAGLLILCLGLGTGAYGQDGGQPLAPVRAQTATGPLRGNPANTRYFTDGSGKAIYLAGSHVWSNLTDRGTLNPPQVAFDYPVYIQWMVAHNFNFMRLWASELTDCGNGPKADVDEGIVAPPTRWMRTGPGYANDGRLKYDLAQFDQSYFDRMRARTIMAGENGIYVSVMLFNGFEFQFETNEKDGDPFRDVNNINNISCPGNCPADSAQMPDAVWSVEKAYIRKVIDTVNDLDNVLYEVSNESQSPFADTWEANVISYIKQYEATKPKHHPVGWTFEIQGFDSNLFGSAADWISPRSRVTISDGSKVVINDTDHSYNWRYIRPEPAICHRNWAWENFTSGNNVAFMDPYLVVWTNRNTPEGTTVDPRVGLKTDNFYEPIREAMGATLTYANRMNLVAMTPQPALSSTHFCLANPGTEYLVYQPFAKDFTVDLVAGTYQYELLNAATNRITASGTISVTGGDHTFSPTFSGDAVVYLHVSLNRQAPEGSTGRELPAYP
jgi:hypothetical protein